MFLPLFKGIYFWLLLFLDLRDDWIQRIFAVTLFGDCCGPILAEMGCGILSSSCTCHKFGFAG